MEYKSVVVFEKNLFDYRPLSLDSNHGFSFTGSLKERADRKGVRFAVGGFLEKKKVVLAFFVWDGDGEGKEGR